MKKSQHHVNPHLIIQFQDGKTYFFPGALTHRADSTPTKKHSEKGIILPTLLGAMCKKCQLTLPDL